MIKFFLLIFWMLLTGVSHSQQVYADSMKQALQIAKSDNSKISLLAELSTYYCDIYPDSGLYYADRMIEASVQSNNDYGQTLGYYHKGWAFDRLSNQPMALKMAYSGLQIAEKLKKSRLLMMGKGHELIGHLNAITGKDSLSKIHFRKSINFIENDGNRPEDISPVYSGLAYACLISGQKDSALLYAQEGYRLSLLPKNRHNYIRSLIVLGNCYKSRGDFDKAKDYFKEGIKLSKEYNAFFFQALFLVEVSAVFFDSNVTDSCIYYGRQAIAVSQKYNYPFTVLNASAMLTFKFDPINTDSAYKYLKIMLQARDKGFNEAKIQQFQLYAFDEEQRLRDLENQRKEYKTQTKIFVLLASVIVFFILVFFLYRNNRYKQKAYNLLQQQKKETDSQKNIVEKTLNELKSTQSQLIQSEKMASLGELTAGIAHEIQNPLNFVNNFSEVSTELVDEMNVEIDKGNIEDAKEIANDLKQNLEKINHHGKRAGDIVKGMLQHSRSSSATKEPTDINKLADEYLRLAYHGLRAKDKSFNATMKTNFDETIGNISIIPQDIGRVILNLINNAFYVVDEKQKAKGGKLNASASAAGQPYEPIVEVSTKKVKDKVEVMVKDNGNGIPQKILDKIFQPFFTTKPTGQGTGLGLSLSYDIVKAHGGELKVETKEGEGTEFKIILP